MDQPADLHIDDRGAFLLPAKDEEETISYMVRSLRDYGRVIVIDDHSLDNTASLAVAEGAEVLTLQEETGYDQAIERGFCFAIDTGAEFLITADSDGQHTPADILKIQLELVGGNELCIGVRRKMGRLSETIFSFYTRLRYGILDPLCGLKGYHASIHKKHGPFDNGDSLGTKLAIDAVSEGCQLKQVYIATQERRIGTSRFGGSIRVNMRILLALIRLIRSRI